MCITRLFARSLGYILTFIHIKIINTEMRYNHKLRDNRNAVLTPTGIGKL